MPGRPPRGIISTGAIRRCVWLAGKRLADWLIRVWFEVGEQSLEMVVACARVPSPQQSSEPGKLSVGVYDASPQGHERRRE